MAKRFVIHLTDICGLLVVVVKLLHTVHQRFHSDDRTLYKCLLSSSNNNNNKIQQLFNKFVDFCLFESGN